MAENRRQNLLKIINGTIQAKTYTFASFTIVVVIILLVGAIRPTLVKISEINKEVEQKRIVNTKLEKKIEALSELSNQYADNRDSMDNLPLVFPSQGNFSLLLSNLDEIAKNNGYNLQGINFGEPLKSRFDANSLKQWSARFTVSGSRSNLNQFLQSLESLPMYPTVTKVSYNLDRDRLGQTTFSIEILIYKLEDQNYYL